MRRDLVEILEDSKTDLSRVLIMDRLGSFATVGEEVSNYVTEVHKANRQINKIKEEFDRFYTMFDQLKEEALEIGKKLIELRSKHIKGWENCLAELAKQDFILDKEAVRYIWKPSTKHDHIDILEVYYENTKVSERIIDLLADIQDWDAHWKNHTQRLIDSIYKNFIKERNTAIQTQIKEICHSFGFEETKFVLLKDTTNPYSFEGNSYVSASLDLSKIDTYTKFRRDLRNAIATIIYMTEKCQDNPGKLNINVGDNYMFRFIGEKEVCGNTYTIYESKISKKKALLQVFKNNKRLWGRGRVKALKLLELGRYGKNSIKDLCS